MTFTIVFDLKRHFKFKIDVKIIKFAAKYLFDLIHTIAHCIPVDKQVLCCCGSVAVMIKIGFKRFAKVALLQNIRLYQFAYMIIYIFIKKLIIFYLRDKRVDTEIIVKEYFLTFTFRV